MQHIEPVPRFAHQLVYDHIRKVCVYFSYISERYVYMLVIYDHQYWSKMQHIEPVPRFAHQLVYDHIRKVCMHDSFCIKSLCNLLKIVSEYDQEIPQS